MYWTGRVKTNLCFFLILSKRINLEDFPIVKRNKILIPINYDLSRQCFHEFCKIFTRYFIKAEAIVHKCSIREEL